MSRTVRTEPYKKETTIATTVRTTVAMHRRIKALADADGRSVNNWMLQCIKKHIESIKP